MKFQHAEDFSFTVNFITNTLYIKIIQKSIMKTITGTYVLVRVG